MDATTVLIIAGKELRDTRRNRWVILLSAMFGSLSLALSLLGVSGLGTIGISGFGRTAASLLNLVVLIVPLMGLLIGAVSVAGEREHGTLITLLAQPVTVHEVLFGKFLGAAMALAVAIGLGFGVSGIVIVRAAGTAHLSAYLALAGFTWLLGLVYLGLGFCVSVVAQRTSPAIGVAVVLWLLVTFLSDLGVMGTAIVLRLTPGQLLFASLSNPSQAFHLATIHALQGNLELLGSSGVYAERVLGDALLPTLTALLLAWAVVPLGIAAQVFRRRGGL